jgi:DNA primase
MISFETLVDMVSRKVKLQRRGEQNYWGCCPFHSEDKPSFHIWVGRDGKARYSCLACEAKGDGYDWRKLMEDGEGYQREDPAVEAARKAEREAKKRREKVIAAYRDRNPDDVIPDWALQV